MLVGGAQDLSHAEDLMDAGPWRIHWLDPDPAAVKRGRRIFQERRMYGRVALEHWTGERLPYADNLANLVLVLDEGAAVSRGEVVRVLAPEGEAFVAADGGVKRLVKPRPAEMGEWTHPWQGSDGNLAGDDMAFDAPNAFQWIAGPPFPLERRKDSAGAIVSAGGRVFSITQNVPENIGTDAEGQNYLVARDAFNGTLLWQREWEGPLSRGHADGFHEAVVALADRVYGARNGEVAVFDAATGNEVAAWAAEGTPDKLVLADGVLVAQTPDALFGFDVASGRRMWTFEADNPWGTLASNGRVFFLAGTREADGRWRHELIAVGQRTGEELWRRHVESEHGHRNTAVLRLHFAGDGFVTFVERHTLRALSAEDGSELWHRESEAEARGRGSMDSRQVGHFFVNGKVWMRADRARGGREAPERWLALDPLTGEVRRELEATGPQGVVNVVNKVSCQPLTATQRFVLDARLATAWDFATGERRGWRFARGGCQVGMIPANGLGYVPPNACGCLDEQLIGTLAVVRAEDPGFETFVPAPLLRGPAYGFELLPDEGEGGSDWPTYRRDGKRGAALPASVPAKLTERWKTRVTLQGDDADGEWRLNFGRPLTPPVAADGLVAFAETQSHQVIALDKQTGAERWRFTAGGRVSVPPTLYRGLALFGAHDGYAYALRSDDGTLVWRRRAAPSDRRIMAYGQVESAWPLTGGVLVHEGVALAAAGRVPNAAGGLVVSAFDPASGDILWIRHVEGARYGRCGPLVSDGRHVYLLDMQLDAQTGEATPLEGFRYRRSPRGGAAVTFPRGARYLRGGKAGLLNVSWTELDMGMRKAQLAWTYGDMEGEILAFNDWADFAFQLDAGDNMWANPRSDGGGRILARVRIPKAEEDAPEPRIMRLPKDGWRFRTDPEEVGRDEGWYAPDYDDSGWRDDVPIEASWQEHLEAPYHGAAWYRRSFHAPANLPADESRLFFDGVDEEAWVWLNGQYVGGQAIGPGGWDRPFILEVGGVLKPGEVNHIAVLAKNTVAAAGIWRPIRVGVLDPDRAQWSLEQFAAVREGEAVDLLDAEHYAWTLSLSAPNQVEAMVATDNALFVAGPNDRAAPDGCAFLRAISLATGRELAHVPLHVAPVHDGVAAAHGKVFGVLRDGSVVCLAGE